MQNLLDILLIISGNMAAANEVIIVYHKKTKAVWTILQRIADCNDFHLAEKQMLRTETWEYSKWIWQIFDILIFRWHKNCERNDRESAQ